MSLKQKRLGFKSERDELKLDLKELGCSQFETDRLI